VSPRSEEFISSARERLAGARAALAAGHPELATSAAYYAMLYAARAALSERDLYAKTHTGVWGRFAETFVKDRSFDPALYRRARRAEEDRLKADYEAASLSSDLATAHVDTAADFLDAVLAMVDVEQS
jgi:uncharacterized protein (UPF0332 family)